MPDFQPNDCGLCRHRSVAATCGECYGGGMTRPAPNPPPATARAEWEPDQSTTSAGQGRTTKIVGSGPASYGSAVYRTSRRRSSSTRAFSSFPLTDLFENRDYEGSTHFFFDHRQRQRLGLFSTSLVWTSVHTPRFLVDYTTWPSRFHPTAGPISAASWMLPALRLRLKTARPSISWVPTANVLS